MGNKSNTAKIKDKQGSELTFQQHETDSPILPVPQLEQLHKFKPEAVDWVITQTQIEAEHRREEQKRLNTFVFIHRIIGQIFALIIGITGIVGGAYVAIEGQTWAGGAIASFAITGLAVVFLKGRNS